MIPSIVLLGNLLVDDVSIDPHLGEDSVRANVALLCHNAQVAAALAVAGV